MSVERTLGSVRQPEYVGENRCTPCTAVNVLIAAALGGAVATRTPAVGVAVFGLSLAAIYLRGYLVPGTPTLTKRYLPEWILRKFDKTAAAEQDVDADPESVLQAADAVEPCDDEDDLCLTAPFRSAWRERIEDAREAGVAAPDALSVLGLPDAESALEEHDGAYLLNYDGRRIGKWESRAALVADVTAGRTLAERFDGWDELGGHERATVLSGLRVFLTECPLCDGPVEFGEETVDSCCRAYEVVAVTCADCDARLLETEWE